MPPTLEVNESLLINSWLTVSSAALIVLFFNLCVVREKKNEKKKKEISKSCSVKDLLTAFMERLLHGMLPALCYNSDQR